MALLTEILHLCGATVGDWSSSTVFASGGTCKKNGKYYVALNNENTNINKDPENEENNSFWKEINQTTFGV